MKTRKKVWADSQRAHNVDKTDDTERVQRSRYAGEQVTKQTISTIGLQNWGGDSIQRNNVLPKMCSFQQQQKYETCERQTKN